MPVTYLNIEWPNKETDQVYSPSRVIEEYFTPGNLLTIEKFLQITNEALTEASERVRRKYGYACTSAQEEIKRVSLKCKNYNTTNSVKIISIK